MASSKTNSSSKSTTKKSASKTTTKSTASKSATGKSATGKSSASARAAIKPGKVAGSDLKLYVKDSRGRTLGEINVPAGSKATPKKTATSYQAKK